MARAGVEKIQHINSGKEVYVEIKFSAKTKGFVISNMPEDFKIWYSSKKTNESVGSSIRDGSVYGSSYEQCVNKVKEAFNEYCSAQVSEEKMIGYRVKSNRKGKANGIPFCPDTALAMEYAILWKITVADEVFLSTASYEQSKQPDKGVSLGGPIMWAVHSNVSPHAHYDLVPHTDELEEFFEKTLSSLRSLLDKVTSYFGDSQEHFLESFKNQKLLGQ